MDTLLQRLILCCEKADSLGILWEAVIEEDLVDVLFSTFSSMAKSGIPYVQWFKIVESYNQTATKLQGYRARLCGDGVYHGLHDHD